MEIRCGAQELECDFPKPKHEEKGINKKPEAPLQNNIINRKRSRCAGDNILSLLLTFELSKSKISHDMRELSDSSELGCFWSDLRLFLFLFSDLILGLLENSSQLFAIVKR
jgi:hypothetical protein